MNYIMCGAPNPAPESQRRWWHCSLPDGHAGEHRAHRNHDAISDYDSWPNDSAPAPAPIDPLLVTLTVAALPECIRMYCAQAEREGFHPDWQTGVALDAIKIALATRAALGKAEAEGDTK